MADPATVYNINIDLNWVPAAVLFFGAAWVVVTAIKKGFRIKLADPIEHLKAQADYERARRKEESDIE